MIPCWEIEERYGTASHCSSVLETVYFCIGWAKDGDLTSCSFQYLLLYVFQIIDPFVEVEVIGLPVDCFKEQTRVVDDNGKIMWGFFS